jgi:hypothetical protein
MRTSCLAAPSIALALFLATARASAQPPHRTENIILITVDGMRTQELFGGMDPIVSADDKQSGIYDIDRARARFWRPTPEARREALMPFFWGSMAPKGVVLGNKTKGSSVTVTNPYWFSYPGYAEILTGEPHKEIDSNDLKRYPFPTIMEFVRREMKLGYTDVATIGSWDGFKFISSAEENAFFTNAGYEKVAGQYSTPRMNDLSVLQFQIMALWETGRSDAVTFGIGLEYLKTHHPRFLYIALGEPDDWAHARRYDRLLDYINVFDGYLRELWETVESSPFYKDKTTIVITTDHGRGVQPADWAEHDADIQGSQDIWIAAFGPDTPHSAEATSSPPVHQADIAATILQLLGLDGKKFNSKAGPPIQAFFNAQDTGPKARADRP